jgi:hypothetical protein
MEARRFGQLSVWSGRHRWRKLPRGGGAGQVASGSCYGAKVCGASSAREGTNKIPDVATFRSVRLLTTPALFLLYSRSTSIDQFAPEVVQCGLNCRITLVCPAPAEVDYSLHADIGMGLISTHHVGARKPGDRRHWLRCEPVSARRAGRIRRSRSNAWRSSPGFLAEPLGLNAKPFFEG